jgi:hypothetical protein
MRKQKQRTPKINTVFVGFIVLGLFVLFFIFSQLQQSILFNHRDRINLVIYDKNPIMYSIGTVDNVHYKMEFDPQTSLIIPGGYGTYKMKSMGELARLDNKPVIIQKAFSSLMSSTIHFYFYNKPNSNDRDSIFTKIMFYQSNVSLLNRLLLAAMVSQKRQSDFSLIRIDTDTPPDTSIEENLFNLYQGYFYQNDLRAENRNIQLVYHTRSSISTISRILEGDGMRVVDISYHDEVGKGCTVLSNSKAPSTEHYFAVQYKCIIKHGDTGGQDMVIELGSDIEKEWE